MVVNFNGRVVDDDGRDERDLNVPPSAVDAEGAVLGSVLKNPRCISLVADMLTPRDFYDKRNGLVWAAMLALEADGKPIDYHLLGDKLRQQQTYDKSGGLMYLSEISLSTPTSAFVKHYAEIVGKNAAYRQLISDSQSLAEAAWKGDKTPESLMDTMQRRLAKLAARAAADEGGATMSTALEEALAHIERERESFREFGPTYVSGLKTGLRGLDEVLLGMKPGDLIYLAARTSVGKSILAQQIALNVANHGGAVVYASLEMSYLKLTWRALTMTTGVMRHEMTRGNVSNSEWADVQEARTRMQALPLFWETSARTVEAIRRRVQRYSDEIDQPVALVVVDYVQLLRDSAGPRANRYENVSAASHALKEMAESMGCTVLSPAQVSRAVTNRSSKMPDLSDLRESGDLEQDCDVALGLDRADYYDRNATDHSAVLAVLKARDLAAGRGRGTQIPLGWSPKYERYADLERDNVIPFRRAVLPDDAPLDATPADGGEPEDLPF